MGYGQKPAVDCHFPGGNIVVDSIEGNTISVHQDVRDTFGDWFYWYFRVQGAAGRLLRVRFTGSPVIGVHGPAMSLDGGLNWRWLDSPAVDGQTFRCDVPASAEEVRFSFGMPYQEKNLGMFLDRHRADPHLVAEELCQSEHGRTVELLRAGRTDGTAGYRVLLTCRHHSCEMMASYVLEGVMGAVLTDGAAGQSLRDQVEFFIVPFVDKDGVEEGDQGKNRLPHDHNRDYGDTEGRYASVRAIRNLVRDRLARKIDVAFDLHCPSKFGPLHEAIHFVGTPDHDNWRRVIVFSDILERVQHGSLIYHPSANLPHGAGWNTDAQYEAMDGSRKVLTSFNTFLDREADVGVHAGLEIPYANASSHQVNAETARAFGVDLAYAIDGYLRGQTSTRTEHTSAMKG